MINKTSPKKKIITKVILDWKEVNAKFPNQEVKEFETQDRFTMAINKIGKNLK